MFANKTGETMLGAGGTEFRPNTKSWVRTVRHSRSGIFISADSTPGGRTRCDLPESVVGALEKQNEYGTPA